MVTNQHFTIYLTLVVTLEMARLLCLLRRRLRVLYGSVLKECDQNRTEYQTLKYYLLTLIDAEIDYDVEQLARPHYPFTMTSRSNNLEMFWKIGGISVDCDETAYNDGIFSNVFQQLEMF